MEGLAWVQINIKRNEKREGYEKGSAKEGEKVRTSKSSFFFNSFLGLLSKRRD